MFEGSEHESGVWFLQIIQHFFSMEGVGVFFKRKENSSATRVQIQYITVEYWLAY